MKACERPRRHYSCRRAAVEILGWDDTRTSGQKLMRRIRRRERMEGVSILVRHGAPPSPLLVTEAQLRDHFPELFSKKNELASLLRKELEDVRDKLAELKLRDNALAASIRDLRGEVRKLASTIHQRPCGPS